jgi:hypothetical protein
MAASLRARSSVSSFIDVTTNKRLNHGELDLGVTSFGPRHAPVRSGLRSPCICLGNLRRHALAATLSDAATLSGQIPEPEAEVEEGEP